MGPILLLDKSALQSLSAEEFYFVQKHYFLNIPPILITEVLGNLAKENLSSSSEQVVSAHANKLHGLDRKINLNFRQLSAAELMGATVTQDLIPVVGGGVPVRTESGEQGWHFNEQPEVAALRRWREKNFSEAERILAHIWRDASRKLDTSVFAEYFHRRQVLLPRVNNLQEARSHSLGLLRNCHLQEIFLEFLLDELNLQDDMRHRVKHRWSQRGSIFIEEYAPYCFYCLGVYLLYVLATRAELVPWGPTTQADLEYLFYLPFCMAFCSGDKFHRKLAPLLLSTEQNFVTSEVLKSDLNNIRIYWESLSNNEKREYFRMYSDYPPPSINGITSVLWKKHMLPWGPGSGDIDLTPEVQANLMEKLRPFLEAIEKTKKE